MSSAGSIFVDLLLGDAKYNAGWKRAQNTTTTATNAITSSVRQLASTFAAAFSIKNIIEYSDSYKQLQGRLNLVTTSSAQLALTQERLFKISQDTRSDLGATVTLYQRLTSAVNGLGTSQEEVYKFTEQLNKLLITSGLTSTEAAASIYQLTQAFNKGKLDGDEFRTILESAPPILEALSTSLKKTRGEILQMSKDGKLAPQVLIDAVNGMSDVTDERFKKFQLTLGQAFTQLDNAFLKYIGQSDQVNGATNAIAQGVSAIADNMKLVGDAVTTASIVLGTRYALALTTAAAAQISAATSAVALNLAIGNLAFGTNAAAAGMLALRGASIALGLAIPVAVIGAAVYALYELVDGNDAAAAATQRYADQLGQANKLQQEYVTASADRREQIKEDIRSNIEAYKAEVLSLRVLVEEYQKMSNIRLGATELLGRARNEIFAPLGVVDYGTTPGEVAARVEGAKKNAEELQKILDDLDKPRKTTSATPTADETKAAKKAQDEIADTYRRNIELIDGLDDATRTYSKQVNDLDFLLMKGAISQETYNAAMERASGQFKSSTDEMTQYAKRAAENIQDAFANFLFDPFKDGLKGMVKGFADAIRQMIAQQASATFLKGLGSDSNGGGGILGGLIKSVSGAFSGMFADGGYIEPGKWGIAGEAGAEAIYGGKTGATVVPQSKMGGGNVYNIDARGTDEARIMQLEQMLLATTGPGVIERRVQNAQKRGYPI